MAIIGSVSPVPFLVDWLVFSCGIVFFTGFPLFYGGVGLSVCFLETKVICDHLMVRLWQASVLYSCWFRCNIRGIMWFTLFCPNCSEDVATVLRHLNEALIHLHADTHALNVSERKP